jgi:hypothetical protein
MSPSIFLGGEPMKPSDIKTQLSAFNLSDVDLVGYINELIIFITVENSFAPIKSATFTTDVNATPTPKLLIQDAPVDLLSIVRWVDPPKKPVEYREDGKFIFPYDLMTYTMLYKYIVTLPTVSTMSSELPVDPLFHNYFPDYVRGKYHMSEGEGDEETSYYGRVLVDNVKSGIIAAGGNRFNGIQGPVKPTGGLPWTHGYVHIEEVDDDE